MFVFFKKYFYEILAIWKLKLASLANCGVHLITR
jgi:hypothetical protein